MWVFQPSPMGVPVHYCKMLHKNLIQSLIKISFRLRNCLRIESRLRKNIDDLRRKFRNRQYPVHRWSVDVSVWCLGFRYTFWPAIWRPCRTWPSTWHQRNRLPGPCYDPGWRIRYRPWSLVSGDSCRDPGSRRRAIWRHDHLPKWNITKINSLICQINSNGNF